MIRHIKIKLVLVLIFSIGIPFSLMRGAAVPLYTFSNPMQEQQFVHITQLMRCLVCQNESLADSNADLAKDLRQQIYEMVIAGKTNEDIQTYLVSRYGDFILFKPPIIRSTYILWFLPVVLLIMGLMIIRWVIKKNSKRNLGSKSHLNSD